MLDGATPITHQVKQASQGTELEDALEDHPFLPKVMLSDKSREGALEGGTEEIWVGPW